MFATVKSCAAGAALALLGAAALPAFAAGQAESESAAVQSVNSQIVVRDAATGQLRAPTAAEAAALQSKMPRVLSRPMTKFNASGARGARLTDDFMSYSVVVRQADGSLAEQCFDSREQLEAAMKSGAIAKTNTLPTE